MPVDPLFPDKYWRGTSTGTVAVLCEGDFNSYEADILEKWSWFAFANNPVVDVWPCGTGDGVRGMADAMGRTVRIFVLLDRDFHDATSAAAVEKEWTQDADRLGWSFLGMRMWGRHEIENYFLDDEVLLPVMADSFGCGEVEVRCTLEKAIDVLVPFQALQAAFQKCRIQWKRTDPARFLLNDPLRPTWQADGLAGVDAAAAGNALSKHLANWRSRSVGDNGELREPWKGDQLLATFQQFLSEWSGSPPANANWRIEWAGKEVLQLIRQQLAARSAGWWSTDQSNPAPVSWHQMKGRDAKAHDRKIENSLRPRLIDRLIEVIKRSGSDTRWAEFKQLEGIIRSELPHS